MSTVVKRVAVSMLVLVMFVTLAGCGKAAVTPVTKTLKVGLLAGVGGLGDKSFNDLAYDGAKKAETELGITLKVAEPPDLASEEGLLRDLANAGNDLVIAVGFDMADPLKKVAAEFPNIKFAVIDATVDEPNVASLVFAEHEGSFLVGALAALMSKSNKVGAIPAMDVPFLTRFTKAYEQGAKYIKPDIQVIIKPIGSDFNAFNDPAKCKSIALSMYAQGCDVIYHAAGGSGSGLFEAAKQVKKYAIGCNSDQDYMAPGLILTSMMKRVDVATYDAIKGAVDGTFKTGVNLYNVANGGIGITDLTYTKDVIGTANVARIDEIKKGIVDGSIKVIDTLATPAAQ